MTTTTTKPRDSDDLTPLTAAVQQLAALLAEPHLDLASWQEAVQRLRQEIAPRTRTSALAYAVAQLAHATGRRYPLLERGLELLSPPAQSEFKRLLDDLDGEARSRERRAGREPWRFLGR